MAKASTPHTKKTPETTTNKNVDVSRLLELTKEVVDLKSEINILKKEIDSLQKKLILITQNLRNLIKEK